MQINSELSNDLLRIPTSAARQPRTLAIARANGGLALRLRQLLFRPLPRLLNPLISRRAGGPGVALFGLLIHHGRRSGRRFATPLATRPIADGFLVPLTFGSGADWCRNVLTAGSCVVRWNGQEYRLVDPEIVSASAVKGQLRAAFAWPERLQLRLMGIDHYLRLRHSPQPIDQELIGY